VNAKSLSKKLIEAGAIGNAWTKPPKGFKAKDLIGIPWMVAFALRADGWYLRSDIIWHKPNPMPESVKDRPTRAHEYIFLLSKSDRYYYDNEAIKEPAKESSIKRISQPTFDEQEGGMKDYRNTCMNPNRSARNMLENFKRVKFGGEKADGYKTRKHSGKEWNPKQGGGGNGFKGHSGNTLADGRVIVRCNKRDVWTVTTKPFKGAHFATFPADLIEPCIRAGSKVGDTVLDPFAGSGTTLEVAERLGRNSIGIELSEKYVKSIIEPRMAGVHPLFNAVATG
jgi:DNA modification methylase